MISSRAPALTAAQPRVRTIPFAIKAVYGVGEVANSIKTVLFGLFTLFFYTSVMGLPGALVGIAAAAGLAVDACLDPYIGHFSDHGRYRLGRRHTFMLVGSLTMGFCLWAFFNPPRHASTLALFAWLLVTGTLVRITTSLYNIPYFALGAELSDDYHERTAISAMRGGLALVGTLLTAALSFVVFFPNTVPGVDPKLNYDGYSAMGLTAAILMTAVALFSLVATLAWRTTAPRPSLCSPDEAPSIGGAFRQSFRSAPFRAVFFSVGLFYAAVTMNSIVAVYFLTYYAVVAESAVLSNLQLAFYIGGLAGVTLWLLFGRRISLEKARIYLFSAISTGALAAAAYLLLGNGRPLGTSNVTALVIGHVLAGFTGSALWFIPASMLADIADADEIVTGQRREGVFFGMFFFGQKVAIAFAALTAGLLLDWYAGLVPQAARQSASTAERIGVLYGLLPALLLLLAAAIAARYSLGMREVAALRSELDRRHGELPQG